MSPFRFEGYNLSFSYCKVTLLQSHTKNFVRFFFHHSHGVSNIPQKGSSTSPKKGNVKYFSSPPRSCLCSPFSRANFAFEPRKKPYFNYNVCNGGCKRLHRHF